MPVVERSTGLRIELPDTLRVGEMATPRRSRRTRAPLEQPAVPTDAETAAAETEVVTAALAGQGMELVDSVPLQPIRAAPARPAAGRRGQRPASVPSRQNVEFSLPIASHEHAVVLLEQDGVYRWKLPDEVERPAQPTRRRGPRVEPALGVATFRIDLEIETPSGGVPPGRGRRGVITHIVFAGVRVFVLKFAAHAAVGKVMAHLEQHVRTGLVTIASLDPAKWAPVEPADVKLPRDRPARILLLIHGTFSSTVGAFSALGVHAAGKAFLQTALASYDVVLGFNHRTLTVDPLENASELLALLGSLKTSAPPIIDVITHSRGGLVTRSVTELLLPTERERQPRLERVVFVAGTNHGTLLAEPDNWKEFVDLYTNLALAGTRALGLVPQAALFATVVGGMIQGVGALVKALVNALVTENDAPGLAAMRPDGAFVTRINETQPGQPDPQHSSYFTVTSNFEPGGRGEGPTEMPPRLLMMLADGFLDRLFRAPNDLVVDVDSMGSIDPQVGGFVDDTYDFGSNRLVYHCNYFVRPEVAAAMARWLDLEEAAGAADRTTRARVTARASRNFIEVGPGELGTSVRAAVREANPEYVVIRRPRGEGGYVYAFHRDEVMNLTRGSRAHAAVRDSLALGEKSASAREGGSEPDAPPGWGALPTTGRTVLFAGDEPAAVLPAVEPPSPRPELAGVQIHSAAPSASPPAGPRGTAARARGGRRVERPAAARGGGATAAARPAARRAARRAPVRRPPPTTTPHVYADMPPEVRVGQTASVHVEISAHELVRAAGRAARGGQLEDAFDPSKPLVVQVLARANFDVDGEDRATVTAPGPEDPNIELYFDLIATHEGSGEVWVAVRQGVLPLLTLVLNPQITGREEKAPGRRTRLARADAALPATVPAEVSLPTLEVFERRTGDGTVYQYELVLPGAGRHTYSSKPILGDRDAYVNGIYRYLEGAWIQNNSDVRKFAQAVRAYGGQLFDELFPAEIQVLLWKHRNGLKNIYVFSTEPFIPWELVHLKNPSTGTLPSATSFLAQMGLVRWLWNQPDAALTLQVRPDKAWYLTPAYPDDRYVLQEPPKEAEFLERLFGARAVPAQSEPVIALLSRRNKVDLFHFAGHGGATGGSVQDARILLQGRIDKQAAPGMDPYITDELSAMQIRQQGKLADPEAKTRPLVVLNACQAGRAGMQLTSIGGFADAFIHAGAGAFVSSLWSVGDEPAASFTMEFYSRLKQGKTIADAAVSARESARKAGDATWLAYVVYGHPDAKLARP
jgi:hypothetical protein